MADGDGNVSNGGEGRGPDMFAHIGLLKALKNGEPEPPIKPLRKRAKVYRTVC